MRRIAATLLAALLLSLSATAALAKPPQQISEPLFINFPDPNNGVVVFWNITREDFCAWEATGFEGPPPVEQNITQTLIETGKGAIVSRWSATRSLELWTLNEDADFSGACADTDDSTEPWATGSATVRANDNDLDVSGTRTNSFGDRGNGQVWDQTGERWSYSWVFRAHINRYGAFEVKVDRATLRRG